MSGEIVDIQTDNGTTVARVKIHYDEDGYHWINPWEKIHKDVLKKAFKQFEGKIKIKHDKEF